MSKNENTIFGYTVEETDLFKKLFRRVKLVGGPYDGKYLWVNIGSTSFIIDGYGKYKRVLRLYKSETRNRKIVTFEWENK